MKALYYGDNLQVLRDNIANESVDLIYLDPPFNSKATVGRANVGLAVKSGRSSVHLGTAANSHCGIMGRPPSNRLAAHAREWTRYSRPQNVKERRDDFYYITYPIK